MAEDVWIVSGKININGELKLKSDVMKKDFIYHLGEKSLMNVFSNYYLRPMGKYIKANYKDPLVGIEIGTAFGYNAKNMLIELPIKKLYCIDAWKMYGDYTYENMKEQTEFEKTCLTAINRLKPFKDKIEIIRKFSDEAVNDVPKTVDFVYIDGNHEYEFVKKDIEMYEGKVRKGGVIGGHDIDGYGVLKAFVEYVHDKDYKYYVKGPDWWVVKC